MPPQQHRIGLFTSHWGGCQLPGSLDQHCTARPWCVVWYLLPVSSRKMQLITNFPLERFSPESAGPFWLRNYTVPLLSAFRGMILWAVTAELLFSTTANRRNTKSSKCTRNRNCSFHMGLSVLRWMGLVRKWQLSRGIPSTSISMQGLPVLLLGQTFWPDTICSRGAQRTIRGGIPVLSRS